MIRRPRSSPLFPYPPLSRSDSSFFSPPDPPSARQHNWRKGSNSSRNMHILTILEAAFGGGGRRSKWRPAVQAGQRSEMKGGGLGQPRTHRSRASRNTFPSRSLGTRGNANQIRL